MNGKERQQKKKNCFEGVFGFPLFFFLVFVFQLEIRGKGNNKLRCRCFSNPSRRYFFYFIFPCVMRVGGRARLSVTTKTTQVFPMSISLILDVGHSVSNRFFFYQSPLFFQRCISFGVSGAFNAKPLYLNGFFVNRLPPILHAQVEMVASIHNQFI